MAQVADSAAAVLTGVVVDAASQAGVELVDVFLADLSADDQTSAGGRFRLVVPAGRALTLVVRQVGFAERRIPVAALRPGQERELRVALALDDIGVEVTVTADKLDDGFAVREQVDDLRMLPSTTGNLEQVLPAIALGVSAGTGGELSSQYNVRGGNYDENLVYVNDFEIYRPQLIRTGQQEGLTFANLDLTQSISFSSGGFEARYGDKASSVLDVRYKRPDSLAGSVNASLLGASAHVEGSSALGGDSYRRLRFLGGARYKTTRYLLSSLDTEGEYVPDFLDAQGYLTYDLSRAWQLAVLGNYNSSVYRFEPEARSTGFGQLDVALRLQAALDGSEADAFTTGMGGVSLTYVPERERDPLYLKFLGSGFHLREIERFDLLTDYVLGVSESDLRSDDFGEIVQPVAAGSQQRYARNYLYSNVFQLRHLGGVELQSPTPGAGTRSHFVQWGLSARREDFADRLNEWERLDSAGFSLPYDPDEVLLEEVFRSRNTVEGYRFSAFAQDTWTWRDDAAAETRLNVGVRAGYWTVNEEPFVTPRAQLLVKPLGGRRDISYRLAAGLYYQPPFYRELRRPDGSLNLDVRAQKSAHAVAGMTWDYNGRRSGRPRRLIVEGYYKRLWDQISYEVDNVRIRYSGENDAEGYVAGLDMRLNGEFVPGTESWFNLSLLRARESLVGVQHRRREVNDPEARDVETVPRPTDQAVTASVFFQDYLPGNDNFQVNLNATVGSGLPYGIPDLNEEFRNTYRFAAYRRVDIGFAAQLWRAAWRDRKPRHVLRDTEDARLALEVFNVLGVQNVASNLWVKSIFRQQFAVPNYLTGRRLNLRLRVGF